jgi:DNA-3-methyladenine glycosylase
MKELELFSKREGEFMTSGLRIDFDSMEEVPIEFFSRCVDQVAAELIGSFLLAERDGEVVGGQIIETEAYCQIDPAAHCYNSKEPGKPKITKMNKAMFCPAGYVYVYPESKSHPNDCCVNLVCGPEGFGSAVLIRALRPIESSIQNMATRRARPKNTPDGWITYLCDGPTNLCYAMDITYSYDRTRLGRNLNVYRRKGQSTPPAVDCGPRILGKADKTKQWYPAKDWPRRYALSEIANDGILKAFLGKTWKTGTDFSSDLLEQLNATWRCSRKGGKCCLDE